MTDALPAPRAVLFDWDDTLVDTWGVVRAAYDVMFSVMGHTPWTEEEARERIGPSARELFPQLFGDRWQEADAVFVEAIREGFRDNVKTVEGAREMLDAVAGLGVFMGVVSNKRGPLLREEVGVLGWDGFFKTVVGAGDAIADKPDPAAIRQALIGSGIEPGPDVWFIGNNHVDMECARRAGCTALLLETKLPPEELLASFPPLRRFAHGGELAHYVINSFNPKPIKSCHPGKRPL